VDIAQTAPFTFSDKDISHPVYRAGSGPAVILCHELTGLAPQCVAFANELVGNGFTVYMPLLFGRFGQDSAAKGIVGALCIARELGLFAGGAERPLTAWLRALCRKAQRDCFCPGVGVIGMCITGNFAISLMADDNVLAPVASQPGLPAAITPGQAAAIGVTAAELEAAKARAANGAELMTLHFTNDRVCPPARIRSLAAHFGGALTDIAVTSPDPAQGIKPNAHSVLTLDFCDQAGHPTRIARNEVIAFLHRKL
jgi:dienelactone hydrolase